MSIPTALPACRTDPTPILDDVAYLTGDDRRGSQGRWVVPGAQSVTPNASGWNSLVGLCRHAKNCVRAKGVSSVESQPIQYKPDP